MPTVTLALSSVVLAVPPCTLPVVLEVTTDIPVVMPPVLISVVVVALTTGEIICPMEDPPWLRVVMVLLKVFVVLVWQLVQLTTGVLPCTVKFAKTLSDPSPPSLV